MLQNFLALHAQGAAGRAYHEESVIRQMCRADDLAISESETEANHLN
jgi:hypothetical protein